MCDSLKQIHLSPNEDKHLFHNAVSRQECTCRSYSRSIEYKPLHILHFQRVFRRRHSASCPKSRTSEDSLEYMMKFVPPKWLLAHTIHLGLSIKTTAINGSFSIAPVVLGVSRIIDKKTSPAFRLLRQFEDSYRELRQSCWDGDDIDACRGPGMVSDVESSLRYLFDNGLASPLDEDDTGTTVLHVSHSQSQPWKIVNCVDSGYQIALDLYRWYGSQDVGISHSSRPLGDNNAEFMSLLWFLLERGSNPNVVCSNPDLLSIGKRGRRGGTAMDIFASQLSFPLTHFGCPASGAIVRNKIAAVGGEFSRPAASYSTLHSHFVCKNFEKELVELTLFPEQFDRKCPLHL